MPTSGLAEFYRCSPLQFQTSPVLQGRFPGRRPPLQRSTCHRVQALRVLRTRVHPTPRSAWPRCSASCWSCPRSSPWCGSGGTTSSGKDLQGQDEHVPLHRGASFLQIPLPARLLLAEPLGLLLQCGWAGFAKVRTPTEEDLESVGELDHSASSDPALCSPPPSWGWAF